MMGFLDKLREMAGKNPSKTRQGADQTLTPAEEKTGGTDSQGIDQGAERTTGALGGDDGDPG